MAGFPIGGESFCLTSGVVSRVEVVEYSHSGRSLLALQVQSLRCAVHAASKCATGAASGYVKGGYNSSAVAACDG